LKTLSGVPSFHFDDNRHVSIPNRRLQVGEEPEEQGDDCKRQNEEEKNRTTECYETSTAPRRQIQREQKVGDSSVRAIP
jgi:hypothetical protein